jgi:hypothetical protein
MNSTTWTEEEEDVTKQIRWTGDATLLPEALHALGRKCLGIQVYSHRREFPHKHFFTSAFKFTNEQLFKVEWLLQRWFTEWSHW